MIYNGAEIYLNPRQLLSDDSRVIDDFLKDGVNDKCIDCEGKDRDFKKSNLLNKRTLNEIETKIISCLKDEEKTVDEISMAIQISPSCFEY